MKRFGSSHIRSRNCKRVKNNSSVNLGRTALHEAIMETRSSASTVSDPVRNGVGNNEEGNGSREVTSSVIQTETSLPSTINTEGDNAQQPSVGVHRLVSDGRQIKRRGRPSRDGKPILFEDCSSASFVMKNVNFVLWNTPFLVMLDNITTNRCPTFQDVLTSMVPQDHPKLAGKSRTAIYGVIDVLLGNVLLKAGRYFNLEVRPFQSATMKLAHFRRYKCILQNNYQSYFQTVSHIRQKISSTPSIFWFLPPVYIIYIVGHMMSIDGVSGSKKIDDHIGSILNTMEISERLSFSDIEIFVTTFSGFGEIDLAYMQDEILKEKSTFKNIIAPEGGTLHIKRRMEARVKSREHGFPFAQFEHIIHDLEAVIESSFIRQVKNKISVMKNEWFSAVQFCINQKQGCSSLYGSNDGDYIYVRPWETIFQVTSFHSQIKAMFKECPYENTRLGSTNIRLSILETIMKHFVASFLLVDKPIFNEEHEDQSNNLLHSSFKSFFD